MRAYCTVLGKFSKVLITNLQFQISNIQFQVSVSTIFIFFGYFQIFSDIFVFLEARSENY